MSWDSRFAEPIELPGGVRLASLREAGTTASKAAGRVGAVSFGGHTQNGHSLFRRYAIVHNVGASRLAKRRNGYGWL